MHENCFEDALEAILAQDPRYHRDAYHFVREALDHTQKAVARDHRGRARQHVTGQELLEGIRPFAIAEFGPMAKTVLEYWGLHTCRDFGEIVFNMIRAGVLAKTDRDTIEDFEASYDFTEAFVAPFLPSAKKPRSRPGSLKIEG